MSRTREVVKRRDPIELRRDYEHTWDARDRAWLQERDVCRCANPRAGPRYFRVTRCTVCSGRIVAQ